MAISTQRIIAPRLLLAASLVLAPVAFAQSTAPSSSGQSSASGSQPQAQSTNQGQPQAQSQTQSPTTTAPASGQPSATPEQPSTPSAQPAPQNKPIPPVTAGAESLPDATVGKAPQPNMEPKEVHVKSGSIEDVNAVGTRNIGGRGLGNWYSTDSEIKMGKQYADEIEKSTKLITDPVVTEYINRVGQNIVKNSDCKVPFTIKVIDTDEINAMALPGGFFYV